MEQKKKAAVALSYDPKEAAPQIIASGKGVIADRIIKTAKESGVPVHEDAPLANTLSKLEIGEYIPKELYKVVADILLFVDDMEQMKKKLGMKQEIK